MNNVLDTKYISNNEIIFIESEQYIHNNQVYVVDNNKKDKISCLAKFFLIFFASIYAGIITMIAALIYKKGEMRKQYLIRGLLEFFLIALFLYGNYMAVCDAYNEYPDLFDGFI